MKESTFMDKRLITFISIFILACGTVLAQDTTRAYNMNNGQQSEKSNTSLVAGSSFSTYGQGMNAFTNYVMPRFNYQLTPKLNMSTGILFMNTTYNGFSLQDESNQLQNSSFNTLNTYVFATGNYRVSDRLQVHASAMKEVSNNDRQLHVNPGIYNMDYSGMSLGFNYKVTDGFEIGGQISIDNAPRYNSYYNSPFHSSPYHGASPFSPYFY